MKIIGIDIGTTSVCGVVVNSRNGKVEKSRTENSNAFITDCNPFEKIQSVERIVNLATDILASLMDEEVSAIGVTGQMHGIVYTDSEGMAVSPLYTWQDGRGNLPYGDSTYAEFMGSCSGYGAVTDFYNQENGIRPESAMDYCTIHDYFVMKLCSLKTPVIHDTDFASFGKGAVCNYGKVVSGFALAGNYKGIPVSVAIGDNQASVFSTLADEQNILLNVGTGSQISLISPVPIEADNIETRPYFDGKYLAVGASLCGGRAYSLLKDFYKSVLSYKAAVSDDEVYGIMAKMLTSEISPLDVDTRFEGTRADKSITGSVAGITESNFKPESLTYGVLKGMCRELYDMYCSMNVEKCGLVGSGNGIRKNKALVGITEEMFGYRLKIPCHVEEAACGAALYAGVAAGIFKDSKQAHSIIKYEDR